MPAVVCLPELSSEQAALCLNETRIAEAGPGSGKTRALVARFIATSSTSNRGVALVSFTNAAVDEARSRCASAPYLLRAPHFVGTIDGFLHRFIVTPAETRRLGRVPTYRSSWDELPERYATVRARGVPGAGVALRAFRIAPGEVVTLEENSLRWEERGYLKQVRSAGREQALVNHANALVHGLLGRGIYDSAAARVKAFDILMGEEGKATIARVARRFGDVLVDEAQDCDAAEFGILRLLRDQGVNVVAVADPDQAIFEFRGGDPALFATFSGEYAAQTKVELTTNYRSTSTICKAVSVLRAAGRGELVAHSDSPCKPVYIFRGSAREQGEKFVAVLRENGIAIGDAVVVAHRRDDAHAVIGGKSASGNSTALGNRLADACACLRPGKYDASARLAAVRTVEDIILELLPWSEELQPMGHAVKLMALDRGPEWLRQSAGKLVVRLDKVTTAEQFGAHARANLQKILDPLPLQVANLSQRLKKPNDEVWTRCQAIDAAVELVAETIHGVKGREFEAVLVALPDDLRKVDGKTVIEVLEEGSNTEARRVLYVGASRARSILGFGAGENTDRIRALLTARGVEVEVG